MTPENLLKLDRESFQNLDESQYIEAVTFAVNNMMIHKYLIIKSHALFFGLSEVLLEGVDLLEELAKETY